MDPFDKSIGRHMKVVWNQECSGIFKSVYGIHNCCNWIGFTKKKGQQQRDTSLKVHSCLFPLYGVWSVCSRLTWWFLLLNFHWNLWNWVKKCLQSWKWVATHQFHLLNCICHFTVPMFGFLNHEMIPDRTSCKCKPLCLHFYFQFNLVLLSQSKQFFDETSPCYIKMVSLHFDSVWFKFTDKFTVSAKNGIYIKTSTVQNTTISTHF